MSGCCRRSATRSRMSTPGRVARSGCPLRTLLAVLERRRSMPLENARITARLLQRPRGEQCAPQRCNRGAPSRPWFEDVPGPPVGAGGPGGHLTTVRARHGGARWHGRDIDDAPSPADLVDMALARTPRTRPSRREPARALSAVGSASGGCRTTSARPDSSAIRPLPRPSTASSSSRAPSRRSSRRCTRSPSSSFRA
jgi:hypothetical protein